MKETRDENRQEQFPLIAAVIKILIQIMYNMN